MLMYEGGEEKLPTNINFLLEQWGIFAKPDAIIRCRLCANAAAQCTAPHSCAFMRIEFFPSCFDDVHSQLRSLPAPERSVGQRRHCQQSHLARPHTRCCISAQGFPSPPGRSLRIPVQRRWSRHSLPQLLLSARPTTCVPNLVFWHSVLPHQRRYWRCLSPPLNARIP